MSDNSEMQDVFSLLRAIEAEEIVDAMGVDWWHSAGRKTFVKYADTLLALNIPSEVVADVLNGLHSAVAGEYGE